MIGLLIHSCDISRSSTTKDPLTGKQSEVWDPVSLGVQCLIQPLSGKQMLAAQGLQINASYKGFYLYATDIKLRDKVTFESKEYFVENIQKGWSGSADHLEVYLRLKEETANV